MRTTVALYLLGLLLAGGGAQADSDHDRVKRLRDAGHILPLESIVASSRRDYPGGRILEAELEFEAGRYVYELKMLTEDGTVHTLEYDARSGDLWRREDNH